MTCILAHGHFAALTLSEPFVKKDSSFHADLLANALHLLENDARKYELICQSDNTCKEHKNNTLVGMHRAGYGGRRDATEGRGPLPAARTLP